LRQAGPGRQVAVVAVAAVRVGGKCRTGRRGGMKWLAGESPAGKRQAGGSKGAQRGEQACAGAVAVQK